MHENPETDSNSALSQPDQPNTEASSTYGNAPTTEQMSQVQATVAKTVLRAENSVPEYSFGVLE